MAELPSGIVTFLFTDIEGSTRLWERDRVAMEVAVGRQFDILRQAITKCRGVLYRNVGDGSQSAFPTAAAALAAALAAQRGLLNEPWADPPGALRVRMALHVGEASPRDGDYLAAPLNRLARLLAAGHGGQILLTQAVQQLVRDDLPPGASLSDLGEYRLRDLQHPEHVFQIVHPDLPDAATDLPGSDREEHRLPTMLTSFLGRGAEIREIVARLRSPAVRLLTITGPGGVGKTRIALVAGERLRAEFADGVIFVDLAPLTDPGLVLPAIASALGVREVGGQPLEKAVLRFLQERHALLILDNFEHLVEAAPVATRLLTETAKPKVLVTSRTSLSVRGEQEFPIASMRMPSAASDVTLESAASTDAVALFVARAKEVRPDFALTPDNVRAVAEICRRLDGLPLALELAAARIKLLSPEALLARFERRLSLLTGGARDLPARQQTLRNTIAWSHDLLSPGEQALFRRMAIFAGGCTFDAAETVCNPGGELDLFEALGSLVDESLVRQLGESNSEPRYLMLETIREFASERLDESGEGEAIRDAHAAWCLALAERWPAHTRYRLESEQTELLETEHDNVRAALVWLYERGDWSRALRLAAAMGGFWFARAHLMEGLGWLDRLLVHRAEGPREVVTDALRWAAVLALFLGDLPAAEASLADALAAGTEAGDDRSLCWTVLFLGLLAEFSGDDETADARYQEALALARASDDLGAAAVALNNLGDCAYRRGDFERAAALAKEATDVARRGNLTFFLVLALNTQAYVALERGQVSEAVGLFGEGLARTGRFINPFFTADTVAGMASAALAAGQPEPASRLLGAVAAICERTGLTTLGHQAQYERAKTLTKEALPEETFATAWDAGRALGPEDALAEARVLADDLTARAKV